MATIYYHDIGDYLSREQKLKMVHDFRSVKSMEWTKIVPNEKRDWINVRDGVFDGLIEMTPSKKYDTKSHSFFSLNSLGVGTSRDAWTYNLSSDVLKKNMKRTIRFYNEQVRSYIESMKKEKKDVEDLIDRDDKSISWSSSLIPQVAKNKIAEYQENEIYYALYRPFFKQNLYYGEMFVHRPGLFHDIYHRGDESLCLCLSCSGSAKQLSVLVTKLLPDLHLVGDSQCFPLYYYEENTHKQKTLFDDTSDDDYIRHDGITDWILKEVRNRYHGAKNISKEMIFYYVYGLLHSKDYRERFAADLKKSLPRIPIVERIEDFMAFYKAGKQLAELHLNYEEVPPHPEVVVHITAKRADQDDYDYFRVDPKMKFRSKDDKSVILYNANIRLENIPLKAYDYIVNGKSAIEWIVERYCVSIDKKSLIKNDANDWAREHGKPRYILDLLLSVINVSTQTVDIVNNLPHLTFD